MFQYWRDFWEQRHLDSSLLPYFVFFIFFVVCESPGRRRQPRKLLRGAGCVWKRTQEFINMDHTLLWCSEDVAPRKRSISEHLFAWMQKWISAPYLKDLGGEAVWSALIYGWLKYTVIKIMRHRLILKNIQYSPTGTWKAPNCDAQTNTKIISNCAQLGVIFCIAVCGSMAD